MKKKTNSPTNNSISVNSLCNHLVGENHTFLHKAAVGTVVMTVGVAIVKSAFFFESQFIHFTAETLGFMIHAIGVSPIAETVIKNAHSVKS